MLPLLPLAVVVGLRLCGIVGAFLVDYYGIPKSLYKRQLQ